VFTESDLFDTHTPPSLPPSLPSSLADPDVKNGANLLDRLIKDIVTESDLFDVEKFIPILKVEEGGKGGGREGEREGGRE